METSSKPPPKRVAILIFDEVEVLDFAGPFEVFGVARLPSGEPAFEVRVVSLDQAVVHARNGLCILPHAGADDLAGVDVLVVPGGYGTRRLLADPRIRALLVTAVGSVGATLSVCTGALVLAASGVLRNLAATTHIDAIEELRALDASVDVRPNARIVDNGRLLTSAGISAGIDAALYLVARIAGYDVADQTARYMQYDWRHRVVDGVHIVRTADEAAQQPPV